MSSIPTITNSSQRPSGASAGDVYYQIDTGKLILWSGSAWKEYGTSPRSHPAITLTAIDHDTIRATITSNGSDNYEIQLFISTSFSNPAVLTRTTAGSVDFHGLSSATTYYVRVISTGNNNGFSYSMTSPAVSTYTAPAVPSISVSTLNTYQLSVSWSNVAGESGYHLQVSVDNSSWSNLFTHSLQYSYTHNVGIHGTRRYYRVRSRDSRGIYSGYSSSANAVTGVTPAAPSLVLASTPENDRASLDWNGVSGANGYQLQISTNSSFTSIIAGSTLTSSAMTVTGLSASTTYYARVRAYRDYGQRVYSAYSNTLTFTTALSQQITIHGITNDDGRDMDSIYYTATQAETVRVYNYDFALNQYQTRGTIALQAGTNIVFLYQPDYSSRTSKTREGDVFRNTAYGAGASGTSVYQIEPVYDGTGRNMIGDQMYLVGVTTGVQSNVTTPDIAHDIDDDD